MPEARVPRVRAPLNRAMPSHGVRGWIGPILVTALAGVLRFVNLGRPDAIIFDETYYAKDAHGLLTYGYEQDFVDKANKLILKGDVSGSVEALEDALLKIDLSDEVTLRIQNLQQIASSNRKFFFCGSYIGAICAL